MVICLERDADLHMAQLMPLPLTVSCSSEILIGFTFLVLASPGSPGKGPLNGCACVCVTSGVLGGIRGYMPYTNLRVFLTAYTHLRDHK